MKKRKNRPDKEHKNSIMDWPILLIVLVLVILGIMMQYSASSYDVDLIKKQGIFALIGFLAIIIMNFIPVRFWMIVAVPAYFITLALCGMCYFVGSDTKGAKRWIPIGGGFKFQPAEFLKIGVLLLTAFIICRYINDINNEEEFKLKTSVRTIREKGLRKVIKAHLGYIIPLAAMTAGAAVVAIITKDLGTAIIIFAIGYIMLLVISPRIKYLIAIIGAALAAGVGMVIAFPYRMGRIYAWLNVPVENSETLRYQIKQGLYAIGSGGLFGKGLGKSIQKNVIPEPHTDMIFSIVCEELGIIGGALIILLFILLV
ncbi:MAG: FtsW/RodA/SpoVE family cell cycle protein, partial [Parasporobacterium sp.]|nr:FtsW/RodA/SpoVE family cell cycle protein [Parasporobacterium sp.]